MKFAALHRKNHFSHVAVQREEDARFIRQNFPTILLQQDFRQVTWGRNTHDGLLAAVLSSNIFLDG
jgi:hypothetical protein